MVRTLVTALLFLGVACAVAQAQGVAPGGPIGGSTAMGSGLGGVTGGTGPSYPNGTPAGPTPPPAIPPGGYPPVGHFDSSRANPAAPSASGIGTRSHYPQPQDPFTTALPQPRESFSGAAPSPAGAAASSPVLKLPQDSPTGMAFLDGCWHTDLFRYGPASTSGVTTYCFDDKGAGRLLYRRVSDPAYFCRGESQAGYEGKRLRIANTGVSCSDGDRSFPATLDCAKAADGSAQCGGEGWTVQLHFIGARRAQPQGATR